MPSARSEPARAWEVKPSTRLSAKEPAVVAVRTTLPVVPAAIVAGLTKLSLALPKVPATASASW